MFNFRLQRILELRVKREQSSAGLLAEARGSEERAREACTAVERARDDGAARAAALQGAEPTVGQLQNVRYVVDRLNHQVHLAHQQASAARDEVQRRLDDFTLAFRERSVLDRLRERDLTGWRAEEVRTDRQTMDGIALGRFARRAAAGDAAAGEP